MTIRSCKKSLTCWVQQWKEWTDSRWVTIGDTSRSFLGALLLSMGDLIALTVQHGHSTYNLSNFAKLSIALNRIIVHASVDSFVSDAVLGMLLSDERLPVMMEAIDTEIQCEVAYIAELPKCVWEIIGLVLGLRPVGLRSAAVQGALTASSYYPHAVR